MPFTFLKRLRVNIRIDDLRSVNVSDLRLGPVSREPVTELALFSHYPEDEPNRAAPDEGATASTSAAPTRRRSLVTPLELANQRDRRAPFRPNTCLIADYSTGTTPLSDLASHHPSKRASKSSLARNKVAHLPSNCVTQSLPRLCLSDARRDRSWSSRCYFWLGSLLSV
jgi:hypothetical protein